MDAGGRQFSEVVVTGPHEVALQESRLDGPLGPGELLIETEATFISAGTELANYAAKDPTVFDSGSWNTYPWRAGYANVGLVQETGPGVSRARAGDRVFTYGKHASLIRYAEERLVVPVPSEVDSVLAAASRMAAVALTALLICDVQRNPTVAVFGLGTVGNLAGQFFGARGCRVIGVDPVAARRDLAARCGIEQTVGGSADEANQELLALTNGQGADIAIDAVGHSGVLMQALGCTATDGQVVLLGTPRVAMQGDLTEAFRRIHLGRLTVRGAHEWIWPMYSEIPRHFSHFGKQQMIFDWMEREQIQIAPLISHRMPPTRIKEAYDGLLHQPETYTGVALVW